MHQYASQVNVSWFNNISISVMENMTQILSKKVMKNPLVSKRFNATFLHICSVGETNSS